MLTFFCLQDMVESLRKADKPCDLACCESEVHSARLVESVSSMGHYTSVSQARWYKMHNEQWAKEFQEHLHIQTLPRPVEALSTPSQALLSNQRSHTMQDFEGMSATIIQDQDS